MSAVTLLAQPRSRAAQLTKARQAARRWIDAVPIGRRGPLWGVLSRACDQAEGTGLRDNSFLTFVKNALRYLQFLHDTGTPECCAFINDTVLAYQIYVSRLRKTKSVAPGQGERPARREARPDEERLAIRTQEDILDAIRTLWKATHRFKQQALFTDFPYESPTTTLEWPDEEHVDPKRIELRLSAMLDRPFVAGTKGRSRLEHERNLLCGHCYAATPSRNTEIRELVWSGVEIWEIARGAEHPLRRWPIEALLCGEVSLDETHVMFITVGRAVPTKSDEYRAIAVVNRLAERFVRYARFWVEDQLLNLKYLRYRSRSRLPDGLRRASGDPRAIELLIDGERITVERLEQEPDLFNNLCKLRSGGHARVAGVLFKLDEPEALALRDLLWSAAAQTRYTAALAAFDAKTPVRDVFSGVVMASREGGVISDAHIQRIWQAMGWTANSWKAQYLRAHAAQLYDEWGLAHLRELGPSIGHKEATTTRDNYTGHTPWGKVRVAMVIAAELEK